MFPLVIKSLYEESFSIQNLIMEMWDFLWVCTFLKNYLPFLGACKHFPTPPESPINKFIKLALSRKKRTICFLNICTSKYLCMDTHTHTPLVFVLSLSVFCILESKFTWWVWWCKFGGSETDPLAEKGKVMKEYSQSGWRRAG